MSIDISGPMFMGYSHFVLSVVSIDFSSPMFMKSSHFVLTVSIDFVYCMTLLSSVSSLSVDTCFSKIRLGLFFGVVT